MRHISKTEKGEKWEGEHSLPFKKGVAVPHTKDVSRETSEHFGRRKNILVFPSSFLQALALVSH